MSIVKSFSVGNGDMFYIKHGSSNFTIIDCCMGDENKKEITDELILEAKGKDITRFISTHPDEDHIHGLDYLDDNMKILNFYCVKNEATKADETLSFNRYCDLRDGDKVFNIHEGCSRKWMNQSGDGRGSSGINIIWPDIDNNDYKDALLKAKNGESPNNISPIIKYSLDDGPTILWMGDLETEFMETIEPYITLPDIDILIAPHHGRDSGKVPENWLKEMAPKSIIIGEAQSQHLNYYDGYNTITQNSAGDIIFDCTIDKAHIYVSNDNYKVNFLVNEYKTTFTNYIGTLNV